MVAACLALFAHLIPILALHLVHLVARLTPPDRVYEMLPGQIMCACVHVCMCACAHLYVHAHLMVDEMLAGSRWAGVRAGVGDGVGAGVEAGAGVGVGVQPA